MGRPSRQADCHPERRHAALGLCRKCYHQKWMDARPGIQTKYQGVWNAKNRDRVRLIAHNAHLRNQYGITRDDYLRMLSEQGGKCKICGSFNPGRTRSFHVDHDHEADVIRGLLCNGCNTGLGQFRDNPEILEKALRYLREHKK